MKPRSAADTRDTPSVVVVDDSAFMRTVITDMLEGGGASVVGEAADGAAALEVVKRERPDVVTMDINMDGMDGIEAVEHIMREVPTPILMLSAHAEDGADVTFEALSRGAVDFFPKPGGELTVGMAGYEGPLLERVRSVAAASVTGPATPPETSERTDDALPATPSIHGVPTLVVGASTGGPGVVERVVVGLPPDAGFRVVVVQHMPDEFTARFAERLNDMSSYRVREAWDGIEIGAGDVVVAKGGHHLHAVEDVGGRLRFALVDDPPVHAVRPAVDPTMRTVANAVDAPLVGVVLTGMGEDGAAGIRRIKDAGGTTIAQDEATSAVFGMPKRAIETGAVDRVVPRDRLVEAIVEGAVVASTDTSSSPDGTPVADPKNHGDEDLESTPTSGGEHA